MRAPARRIGGTIESPLPQKRLHIMTNHQIHVTFPGRIVFIGFGVIGLAYVLGLSRAVGHSLAIVAILAFQVL